jgi:hypothetical protein
MGVPALRGLDGADRNPSATTNPRRSNRPGARRETPSSARPRRTIASGCPVDGTDADERLVVTRWFVRSVRVAVEEGPLANNGSGTEDSDLGAADEAVTLKNNGRSRRSAAG